ncbi:MAG: hypothetical protein JWP97_2312 [Labilithrix sp.]|nr:hypothetical protein [Labilithrix sp.]
MRRLASCLALGSALALVSVACGPPPRRPVVSMRMQGGPPGASVTVDDVFVGSLELVMSRGVALPVGSHRVSVEAPGHVPWDRIVEAREGMPPLRLDVTLVPIPD